MGKGAALEDIWVGIIRPYYPTGKRSRPPIEIEIMLRMYLLQCWFSLSDEGVEDAIYDSYAMRKFMGIVLFASANLYMLARAGGSLRPTWDSCAL